MKRTLAVVVVAVAVAAGAVTGWAVTGHHDSVRSVAGSAPVTTQQLVNGSWAKLPPAPIAARMGEVGLWTGSQMFIWGGSATKGGSFNDGATYDPATRAWERIPEAPLTDRYQAAAVMAGDKVFIWGGTRVGLTSERKFDGATYDPASRRWAMLPAGPTDPYGWAQAIWTGKQVILLTAQTQAVPKQPNPAVIHAYAYNLSTQTWTTLPGVTMPPYETLGNVSAVWTGSQIWMWPHWYHLISKGQGTTVEANGVGTYVYDNAASAWSTPSVIKPHSGSMLSPLWTGSQVVVPTRDLWCVTCLGPRRAAQPGLLIDPATLATAAVPTPSSSMSTRGSYLWTGSDLLAYDAQLATTGPHDFSGSAATHHDGEAAVWDPSTNVWTQLPSAPLASLESVSVWTGNRLLIWGQMYDPIHPAHGGVAGIEYLPGASTSAANPPTAYAPGGPQLTVSPTSGPVGTVVRISGQGCANPGDATTTLSFDNDAPSRSSKTQVPPIASAGGTFDYTWTVPDQVTPLEGLVKVATQPGTYQFSSRPSYCQAKFTVTPTPVTVAGELLSKTQTKTGYRIVIAPSEQPDHSWHRIPGRAPMTYDVPATLMPPQAIISGILAVTTVNGAVTQVAIAVG